MKKNHEVYVVNNDDFLIFGNGVKKKYGRGNKRVKAGCLVFFFFFGRKRPPSNNY